MDELRYVWQRPDWPHWRFDLTALLGLLAKAHAAQGRLLGRLDHWARPERDQASVQTLTEDVLMTSEIEGERLNRDAVRSSIARRLGVDIGALTPADRHVEGVVAMVLDATGGATAPLTAERLLSWHAALFPTGYSGLARIRTGAWRDDAAGPMQVASGPVGRRKVHYEAPPASRLDAEMPDFLRWFNADDGAFDPYLKAGIAHLWLVTLHPFDDGNGRISRAVGDMVLARWERTGQRFYSLSAQIQLERDDYYDQLETTQKGSLDITPWLTWFLGCLLRAIEGAEHTLEAVLDKARFWQQWAGTPMNARQLKLINRLHGGFDGKLTTKKWATIAKCSADTALRDINELLALGLLKKSDAGGRSTGYELIGTRAGDQRK